MNIPTEFIRKIEAADIVSFDIFDTLLVRDTANPTDVFKIAQELFNEKSNFFLTNDFYKQRILAEKQARQNTQRTDVTIYDIYDELKSITGYSDVILSELREYELKTEEVLLKRNENVARLYDYAIEKSKKVAIVSDMYLPAAFLDFSMA